MKKFKRIFYPIYLVVITFVLIISFNIYDSLELFKQWGWFRYFSDLPFMVRDLLVFMCLLMVVELVSENVHLISSKGKIANLEKEIMHLKARLYDQKEHEREEIEEEDDEEDSDEDENEDYLAQN